MIIDISHLLGAHLENRDVLFDKTNSESFCNKIPPIPSMLMTINGTIRGTLQNKFMKSWVWNHLNLVRLEDCACYIK